jgi:hypothetical protein
MILKKRIECVFWVPSMVYMSLEIVVNAAVAESETKIYLTNFEAKFWIAASNIYMLILKSSSDRIVKNCN